MLFVGWVYIKHVLIKEVMNGAMFNFNKEGIKNLIYNELRYEILCRLEMFMNRKKIL